MMIRRQTLTRAVLLSCAAMLATGMGLGRAAEPVGPGGFNLSSPLPELTQLSPATFQATLTPVARREAERDGPIVFYDFTESFGPLFNEQILPRFEKATGLKVRHVQVQGEQAVQQLIAAKAAGQPAPVDLFFVPNGAVRVANEAGIVANLPLHTMLPSAPDLQKNAATVSRGYEHGGVVVPFHRNQTAIGFDTRFVSAAAAPKTFPELLAYARANSQKVAITNPTRGGSGAGILESAMLALTGTDCQARFYDYKVTREEAEAWAQGPCLVPVMQYFRDLKPHVEFTNGNTDTLTLIANGVAHVGTVWEDQGYDFIGRGLLPQSVKFRLLTEGQVGDGDGLMVLAGAKRPAGALLLADFLLSDEIQLLKLQLNGSRSARTGLDIGKALKPEIVERLLPNEQYLEFARPRIVGTISDAAGRRFVAEILQR